MNYMDKEVDRNPRARHFDNNIGFSGNFYLKSRIFALHIRKASSVQQFKKYKNTAACMQRHSSKDTCSYNV